MKSLMVPAKADLGPVCAELAGHEPQVCRTILRASISGGTTTRSYPVSHVDQPVSAGLASTVAS